MPPEHCPNCGADLDPKASVCPECGSDESTGWAEDAYAGGLDIPDESFNYDEFIEKEFGSGKPTHRRAYWIWWTTAVLLIALFVYFFFRGV